MQDATLTEVGKNLRDEVRAFVRDVPRQLILDMDAGKVSYPREFLEGAARQRLLGLGFAREAGGRGRGRAGGGGRTSPARRGSPAATGTRGFSTGRRGSSSARRAQTTSSST